MIIAHASDTHDNPSIIRQFGEMEADMLVLTGDCMKTKGRIPNFAAYGSDWRISPPLEYRYQRQWWRKKAKGLIPHLKGRPILYLRGNHDFISPLEWLLHYGADAYEITDDKPCIELLGKRFAGFRQVLPITGEWSGEEYDLTPFIDKAFACDPQILLTHTPPNGILDGVRGVGEEGNRGYGSSDLTSALMFRQHNITHHLFGHSHYGCGTEEKGGIFFSNAATTIRLIEIP